MELPSKVLHKTYLRVPNTMKVVESNEEWRKCGKWNLHNQSRDTEWLDRAWVALQSLVNDGYLLMLKASTAANKAEDGVIICYTRPEIEAIRRAAGEIRKRVDYRHSMYYKDNGLTEKGVGIQRGYRNFSLYLHTPEGQFYRRNGLGKWELDEDDQAASPLVSSIIKDKIRNFRTLDVDQLPSYALNLEEKLDLLSNKTNTKGFVYFFTCSDLNQDENGLSEADRLWIAAKKLLQHNVLARIVCMKMPPSDAKDFQLPLNAKTVKIQFYIPRVKNISSTVQTICKMAKYTSFFYTYVSLGVGYRYSFNGEVEVLKFTERIELNE